MPRVKEQFSRLRRCKHWSEAEAKLREGQSPPLVAAWLHSQGDYLEANVKSVTRQIERWCMAHAVKKKTGESYLAKVTAEADPQDIDQLRLLNELIAYQAKRLEYGGTIEERLKTPLPMQSKEVRLLADLLGQSLELQMELGILQRAPQKIEAKTQSLSVQAQVSDRSARLRELVAANGDSAVGQLVGYLYGQKNRLPVSIKRDEDGSDDE